MGVGSGLAASEGRDTSPSRHPGEVAHPVGPLTRELEDKAIGLIRCRRPTRQVGAPEGAASWLGVGGRDLGARWPQPAAQRPCPVAGRADAGFGGPGPAQRRSVAGGSRRCPREDSARNSGDQDLVTAQEGTQE